MEWINRNWRVLLIGSIFLLALMIAGELVARFYIGYDFPLEFSLEKTTIFSNLVTPAAAIISAYLFVRLSQRQQRLAESQNLKPHFEEEFKRVEQVLNKPFGIQLPNYKVQCNALNCTEIITVAFGKLHDYGRFREDVERLEKGEELNNKFFTDTTPYWPILEFLTPLTLLGPDGFDQLGDLMRSIHDSGIMREDKEFYMKRIRDSYALPYIGFVRMVNDSESLKKRFSMPVRDTSTEKDRMILKPITQTFFGFHSTRFEYFLMKYNLIK